MINKNSTFERLFDELKKAGAAASGFPTDDSESSQNGSSGFSGDKGPASKTINVSFSGPKTNKGKGILIAIIALILAISYWWWHPAISIHSEQVWITLIIIVALPLFLYFSSKKQVYSEGSASIEPSPSKALRYKRLTFIPVAIVLIYLLALLMSNAIFPGNAEKYSNVLKTDTLEFKEDIKEVDYNQIPVIDRDSAELLGNREMGTISEYVSQFEIESLYSQINYQGKPVRVSPLGYADLIKWFTNRDGGIPAYSLVDMTTQEAKIVRLGDSPIYYSQSEPLERNIDRHVQLKFPTYIFDAKSFEIDEDGHAYWICPVRQYTIGLFGGYTISRVVICDATTGECQDLAIEDVPSWVDRAYPSDLLIEQYNWYGRYNKGWLNSFMGQESVVKTTPGSNGSLGYNYIAKDDDVWVYTGVTSATSDNSIVGFVLINQRTQESHFYSVSGATEDSAMSSAEGQVQNLRYSATFPILINISNQPTYFMALKDSAGLVKKFAMVDIQRYQNVAVGDTVAQTQASYQSLLAQNGIVDQNSDTVSRTEASGIITTLAQAVIDSNSHFYLMIEGDDRLFDFELPKMLDIIKYKVGDMITFEFTEADGSYKAYAIK